jgi:metal-sulfur cluster biosynthetic enzyme
MNAFSQGDVMSRLQGVIDPCSAATKVPLSIVEMGMIEHVDIASGRVTVALRMTSPFCHALPYFEMEIDRVLTGLPGYSGTTCTFDHGGNWEPDYMTAGAQKKLADQRELVRSRSGEKPGMAHITVKPVEVFRSVKAA